MLSGLKNIAEIKMLWAKLKFIISKRQFNIYGQQHKSVNTPTLEHIRTILLRYKDIMRFKVRSLTYK